MSILIDAFFDGVGVIVFLLAFSILVYGVMCIASYTVYKMKRGGKHIKR